MISRCLCALCATLLLAPAAAAADSLPESMKVPDEVYPDPHNLNAKLAAAMEKAHSVHSETKAAPPKSAAHRALPNDDTEAEAPKSAPAKAAPAPAKTPPAPTKTPPKK